MENTFFWVGITLYVRYKGVILPDFFPYNKSFYYFVQCNTFNVLTSTESFYVHVAVF